MLAQHHGIFMSLRMYQPCNISNTRVCGRSWIGNRFGEAHKKITCLGGWEKIVTGSDENALRKARDGRVELIFMEVR